MERKKENNRLGMQWIYMKYVPCQWNSYIRCVIDMLPSLMYKNYVFIFIFLERFINNPCKYKQIMRCARCAINRCTVRLFTSNSWLEVIYVVFFFIKLCLCSSVIGFWYFELQLYFCSNLPSSRHVRKDWTTYLTCLKTKCYRLCWW